MSEPANPLDALRMAQMFHEVYERLAPEFGYATRESTRKPWDYLPSNLKKLMLAVCTEILAAHAEAAPSSASGYNSLTEATSESVSAEARQGPLAERVLTTIERIEKEGDAEAAPRPRLREGPQDAREAQLFAEIDKIWRVIESRRAALKGASK